jgi:hypothetical protein
MTARRLIHPGRARTNRIATAMAIAPRRVLVWLPAAQTLGEALLVAFTAQRATYGAFHLLGGRLDVAAYHVATPHTDSRRAVEYGPASFIEGGAQVVRATGSFGPTLEGGSLLHIHGSLADLQGHGHGGHLNPDRCVIGSPGVRAILMLAVGFSQVDDEETGFRIFFPAVREL